MYFNLLPVMSFSIQDALTRLGKNIIIQVNIQTFVFCRYHINNIYYTILLLICDIDKYNSTCQFKDTLCTIYLACVKFIPTSCTFFSGVIVYKFLPYLLTHCVMQKVKILWMFSIDTKFDSMFLKKLFFLTFILHLEPLQQREIVI